MTAAVLASVAWQWRLGFGWLIIDLLVLALVTIGAYRKVLGREHRLKRARSRSFRTYVEPAGVVVGPVGPVGAGGSERAPERRNR